MVVEGCSMFIPTGDFMVPIPRWSQPCDWEETRRRQAGLPGVRAPASEETATSGQKGRPLKDPLKGHTNQGQWNLVSFEKFSVHFWLNHFLRHDSGSAVCRFPRVIWDWETTSYTIWLVNIAMENPQNKWRLTAVYSWENHLFLLTILPSILGACILRSSIINRKEIYLTDWHQPWSVKPQVDMMWHGYVSQKKLN
jgi:hypothetical protein